MGFLSFLFPPSVSALDAHQRTSSRESLILDVRERHEWKAGHVPGSKNIPLSKLGTRAGELAPDRSYVAVCRSGSRSRTATARLRSAGLDVVNLRGGLRGWHRAGLPLEPRGARIV